MFVLPPDGPLSGGQETFGVCFGGPFRQVLPQLKGSKFALAGEVFRGGPHFLGKQFWINILLIILGYIPGIVHAVWVIAKY